MSQLTTTPAKPRDVDNRNAPALSTETRLITEQEVLFATRAATAPRRLSLSRRFIGAVRIATSSLRLPPPRPHYRTELNYLEHSRMAREMDRL